MPGPSPSANPTEALLAKLLGTARGDDQQLRALHEAISAALPLTLDVHVLGEPLSLVAVTYHGHPRRGLVARCLRDDGTEHEVSFADVHLPRHPPQPHTSRATDPGSASTPQSPEPTTPPAKQRRHKANDDDIDLSKPVALVVLRVKERAARCRLLGSERVITLRAGNLHRVVAGHIVEVQPNRQWRHAGHPLASHGRRDHSALVLASFVEYTRSECLSAHYAGPPWTFSNAVT